jgi:hypothetical protein
MKITAVFEIKFDEAMVRENYGEGDYTESVLNILRGGDHTEEEKTKWNYTREETLKQLVLDAILGRSNHGSDLGTYTFSIKE